ncbi:MAG: hypothetical protein JRG89_06395 [Deltaproteobacteria bacterium]|nr:hypothetical protein [Deltaproteobacteria bacterium]
MKNSNTGSVNWKRGDRVRVIAGQSPYTGCRGTIVEDSGPAQGGQLPLGYYVAIDGENGVAQPFLTDALERIAAVSSRVSSLSRSHLHPRSSRVRARNPKIDRPTGPV